MFPKLISIGGFYLPTYGVLVALGFLAGLAIAARLGARAGLDKEKLTNLGVYCVLAGLVGAKLFMIAFDWQQYVSRPAELLSMETLQSAGVFQGGVVLAFAVGVWYMRREKLPVLRTLDVFAPGLALGHAIGRLGCFAAGCCWGAKCDRAWAVEFTSVDAARLTGVPLGTPLHPTQLYDALAEVLIFGLLYRLATRAPAGGTVMGLYLVLYSTARFFIEFYRAHMQELPFGLPLSLTQWISIAMAIGGLYLLRASTRRTTSHGQHSTVSGISV